jgi:hypothetical protein
VTPVYARIGRQLIDSLRNPTVVQDGPHRVCSSSYGVRQAIAGRCVTKTSAETRWSDALSIAGSRPSWGGVRFGTRLVDSRVAHVNTPPALAFRPIRTIGGTTGWYYANWLWRLRGFIDLLVRGVGLRRGRRDPAWLVPGDTVDFWRVEAFEPDHLLRLFAEMKLPGRAWLSSGRGQCHHFADTPDGHFDRWACGDSSTDMLSIRYTADLCRDVTPYRQS